MSDQVNTKRKINQDCESKSNKKSKGNQNPGDGVNVGVVKEVEAPTFHYYYCLKKEIQDGFVDNIALSVVIESIYKVKSVIVLWYFQSNIIFVNRNSLGNI